MFEWVILQTPWKTCSSCPCGQSAGSSIIHCWIFHHLLLAAKRRKSRFCHQSDVFIANPYPYLISVAVNFRTIGNSSWYSSVETRLPCSLISILQIFISTFPSCKQIIVFLKLPSTLFQSYCEGRWIKSFIKVSEVFNWGDKSGNIWWVGKRVLLSTIQSVWRSLKAPPLLPWDPEKVQWLPIFFLSSFVFFILSNHLQSIQQVLGPLE